MRYGDNWYVYDWDSFRELRKAHDEGSRCRCGLEAAHVLRDVDGDGLRREWVCLSPDTAGVSGVIYVESDFVADVLELLAVPVTVRKFGHTIKFDGERLHFPDACKAVEVRREREYAWKFQKTQVKTCYPWRLMREIVMDTWNHYMASAFVKAGYVASADWTETLEVAEYDYSIV